jgi:hypothetical protein
MIAFQQVLFACQPEWFSMRCMDICFTSQETYHDSPGRPQLPCAENNPELQNKIVALKATTTAEKQALPKFPNGQQHPARDRSAWTSPVFA